MSEALPDLQESGEAPLKPVRVPLRCPITDAEGNELVALTFRPANVRDGIETASIENPKAQEAILFARMCGQPLEVFDKVSRVDMQRIKEMAGPLSGEEAGDLAALAALLGIGADMEGTPLGLPPSDGMPSS